MDEAQLSLSVGIEVLETARMLLHAPASQHLVSVSAQEQFIHVDVRITALLLPHCVGGVPDANIDLAGQSLLHFFEALLQLSLAVLQL